VAWLARGPAGDAAGRSGSRTSICRCLNLQRQILPERDGPAEVSVAAERLRELNPGVDVREHRLKLEAANARSSSRATTSCRWHRHVSSRFTSDLCVWLRRWSTGA
jgi:hypothetical protein